MGLITLRSALIFSFCLVFTFTFTFRLQSKTESNFFINQDDKVEEINEDQMSYPHIIFMMIDDQGFSDIGYNSQDLAGFTPNLDAIAQEGVKLQNYYSLHICTPARAAFLTGLYPIHNGLYHEVIQPNQKMGLSLNFTLLPSFLKQAGYDTHMIGKWHLGHYAVNFTPTARGFDSFYGYFSDQEFYTEHTNNHQHYYIGNESYYFYDFVLNNNPQLQDSGIISTELFQKRSKAILEAQDPKKPLFLFLSWQNVHGPLEEVPSRYFTSAQQELLSSFSDENYYRQTFGQLTIVLDNFIGEFMEVLKNSNIYNNSILIVASDNGGCPFDGGYSYPLRGRKHTLFEGGSRVNSFVHSPLLPQNTRGSVYHGLFHVSDWFSTIIAGMSKRSDLIEHLKLDSIDQWGALTGAVNEFPRTEMVYNIDLYSTLNVNRGTLVKLNTPLAAIRVGDYKYITGEAPSGWFWPTGILHDDAPLNVDYETLMQFTADCQRNTSENATYLFNIVEDPLEMNNLVDSEPDILAFMQSKLDEYISTMVEVTWGAEDVTADKSWIQNNYTICPWVEI